MKKLIYMALGATLLTACGHSDKTTEADSDSIALADIEDMVQTVRETVYVTKDSIGPIHIGMPMSSIPDSVSGLYTKKERGNDTPDAETLVFSDEYGECFIAYDFGQGVVDVLNIIGNGVKVHSDSGDFGLGDSFSNVLRLPGVKAEWAGTDGTGMWYWTCDGLWFAPSQENLSMELSHRLYHEGQAPTPNDFNDEVTVGFIGTGLPF